MTMINNKDGYNIEVNEIEWSITKLLPWLSEFKKMSKYTYTNKNITLLIELMEFYKRNIYTCVKECYTDTLRAVKLKTFISETLILFLYIHRELPKDQERSSYLNYMSDILAMYVDMELKASTETNEDHEIIYSRLFSWFYVYLEHSTEHLLDTLIKIQFMNSNYRCILNPIITRVINNIPVHPESNIMYIRYFLVYCLWKKINDDETVKNQIVSNAIESLGPLSSVFPPYLQEVLPKAPNCESNSTKFLLQHEFDIRKSCDLFIQFCQKSGENTSETKDGVTGCPSSSSKDKSLLRKCDSKPLGTISDNIASKSVNAKKPLSEQKLEKSNEIIVIDLTTDVAFEKCIKKKKSKKLAWLEEVKKQNRKTIRTSPKIKKKPSEFEEATAEINQPDEGPLNLSLTNRSIEEDYHLEDYPRTEISNYEANLLANYEANSTFVNIEENTQISPFTATETACELDVIHYKPNVKDDKDHHESDQLHDKVLINQLQYYSYPAVDTQISYIETNESFTTSSTNQNELENQLLLKIEESFLQNKSFEKTDVRYETESLKYREDINNKLPLKKRLKHTKMSESREDIPIQSEKLESYPAVPMMSIAALESLFTQDDSNAYQKFEDKRS